MANPCKCGRSPNGLCNGWHRLSHPEFLRRLRAYDIKKLKIESDQRMKKKNNSTQDNTE